ncbi:conserved hypothetical protein [Sporisorium reilianum SRZ2]|uniref:Bud22 domain-containing protein n=1 Tax=Sporisorium reilianum (strain SRZ2) TaxID=999809 RepID=E6ZXH0_SPORE|nr:conserved hypothetical protein [Sporisorium reilianum SRZ2]
MGSKLLSKRKAPSPSPELSDASSSEASSSRSAMEVVASSTVDNTDLDPSSDIDETAADNASDAVSDISDTDDEDIPQRPQIDTAKARTKLHHISKTLRATAKKSKTFEVQKLVKKLKGLQKKPALADQAQAAEKELAALKSIDTALLAGRALVTKMVKAKLLPRPAELEGADEDEFLYLQMVRDEEMLGEAVLSDPVPAESDKAAERAKAKITSSKVLADEVGRFVEELKKLAGIEPAVGKKKDAEVDVKGKGKAKLQEEEREWSGSEEESDSEEDAPSRLPAVEDDDEGEEEEEDEEELMRIGSEKMKALGDLSQWDDLIASDSGAESESEEEEEAPSKRKRKSRHDSDKSSDEASSDDDDSDDDDSDDDDSDDDDSDDDDSDDDDSDSDASTSSSSSSSSLPRKHSTKKKLKTSSTFLPSLSTGFIAGRSDDEWSDAEADLADRDLSELNGSKKERKNRMGQRARKALYEKKYGSNANHIKMREKQKQAKLERAPRNPSGRQRPPAFQAPAKKDGGWGGPVAPLPKQPKVARVFRAAPTAVGEGQVGGGSGALKKPVAAAAAAAPKSQEMHPSWIAKQKQKELMAQVKPQGKKVVFD